MNPEPMWRRYLRLTGERREADLDDEMRFHLESRVADYVARGCSPDEARAKALERFGDRERYARQAVHEDLAGARRRDLADRWDAVTLELRFAARRLVRTPLVTATVALSLAFGIGANLAVYRMIDAVVLRPLPGVRDPGSLVEVSEPIVSYPLFTDLRRDRSPVVADLAAISTRSFAIGVGTGTQLVTGAVVSGNYFTMLGARSSAGRLLAPSDEPQSAAPVVVLSHGAWRRLFAGAEDVVGRTVQLNGVPVTVVGIAAPDFRGTRNYGVPALWIPTGLWLRVAPRSFERLSLDSRGWGWLTLIGRLAAGATPEGARAALAVAFARDEALTAQQQPAPQVRPAASATLGSEWRGNALGIVGLLFGAVAVVLLVACLNVSNVMMARVVARERELGIAEAIGAGRGRLRLQVLLEATLVAVVAGGLAIVTLGLGTTLVGRLTLGSLQVGEVLAAPDGRTLALAIGLTLACGLLVALIAMRRPAASSAAALRATAGAGAMRTRARDALIVAQVALCTVLLVLGALFVQSTRRALSADLGFDAAGTTMVDIDVGTARLDGPQVAAFYRDARAAVLQVPGVTAAAVVSTRPLSGDEDVESLGVPGYEFAPDEPRTVRVVAGSAGVVGALGLRLLAGRDFMEEDDLAPGAPVLVSAGFARRYFSTLDVVGREFAVAGIPIRIAGVVADAKYDTPDRDPVPVVWFPVPRRAGAFMLTTATMVVRTRGDPGAAIAPVTAAIRAVRGGVPLIGAGTFRDAINGVLAPQRLGATLFSLFGALALATAAIGLYGMLAYVLSHRLREFGVRIALGARPRDLVALVLRYGLGRVAVGLVAGVVLAQLAAGAARQFLWGTSALDLSAMLAAAAVLGAAALAACAGPARRAARAEPMESLRSD